MSEVNCRSSSPWTSSGRTRARRAGASWPSIIMRPLERIKGVEVGRGRAELIASDRSSLPPLGCHLTVTKQARSNPSDRPVPDLSDYTYPPVQQLDKTTPTWPEEDEGSGASRPAQDAEAAVAVAAVEGAGAVVAQGAIEVVAGVAPSSR